MTFREWNREKQCLPYGQHTGIDNRNYWCACKCCLILKQVWDKLFNEGLVQVLDCCKEGKLDAEDYFAECDKSMMRFVLWVRGVVIAFSISAW